MEITRFLHTPIELDGKTANELASKCVDIYLKHDIPLDAPCRWFYSTLFFINKDGEITPNAPCFDQKLKTIQIVLGNILNPFDKTKLEEQFVFQYAHELAHYFLDVPFFDLQHVDWREEFVATVASLVICSDMGEKYLSYALCCLRSKYADYSDAIHEFIKKACDYKTQASKIYSDNICLPLLYFQKFGGSNLSKMLKKVKAILTP